MGGMGGGGGIKPHAEVEGLGDITRNVSQYGGKHVS